MWESELTVAKRAAMEAGAILNSMFDRAYRIQKKGVIDLVTEADLAAEQIILERIHRHFPQDSILSEETGAVANSSERTWVIDPLDGTTNFAHGFPFFAVSIALEVEKEIVVGVILDPRTHECFEGVKGRGSYISSKSLRVSKTARLNEALVATGFPYDIRSRPRGFTELLEKMLISTQGVRRPGSAALDLCYVAAGRLDGFWEQGLEPWDTAAGTVILKEAGGILTTFDGDTYSPRCSSLVAANPLIHQEMLDVLDKGSF